MSRSVFPYPGGKTYLASWIVGQIPAHRCYVEVFGGSASILLNKPESRTEVFNDADGDVVHFFRTLRERGDELREWLTNVPHAREVHEKWSRWFYDGVRPDDDVERAGRFFTLRYTQFASKYASRSGYNSARADSNATPMVKVVDDLESYRDRFRSVQIECLDYRTLVDKFDAEDTFFYFDPPYVEEGDALYTHIDAFDHSEFVETLGQLEGDWMASYRDLPPGLSEYHTDSKPLHQRMNDEKDVAEENVVMNYDPSEHPSFTSAGQSTLSEVA